MVVTLQCLTLITQMHNFKISKFIQNPNYIYYSVKQIPLIYFKKKKKLHLAN